MSNFTETIAPDEDARFNGYANELRALQKARSEKTGVVSRALHVKQHVGVVAQLVVGDVPEKLRVAVFSAPKTWPVYVRYSNGASARQKDGAPDARALAFKIVGVPGKKIIPGLEDKKTQDFLFILTPSTPFRTPEEFVMFARAAWKGGPPGLIFRLLGSFGIGRGLSLLKALASSPNPSSLATARFYTAAPVKFGETAAKLSLVPVGAAESAKGAGADAFRDDLVTRLKAGALTYSLRVQTFVDDETTPIEDASAVWPEDKSAYVEVAKLVIPQQDVSTTKGKEIDALVDKLSFDPWHALPELRPLGAMMRARAIAYRESVIGRNASPEPDDVVAL